VEEWIFPDQTKESSSMNALPNMIVPRKRHSYFFLSTLRSTVADYHVLRQFVLVRCIAHQSLNEQRTIVNLMTDKQCSEATQDEE
jgi:hypothetical protein